MKCVDGGGHGGGGGGGPSPSPSSLSLLRVEDAFVGSKVCMLSQHHPLRDAVPLMPHYVSAHPHSPIPRLNRKLDRAVPRR
jgi:hypothetical protein